jgi:dextranase
MAEKVFSKFSITPDKGTYQTGEEVVLTLTVSSTIGLRAALEICYWQGLVKVSKQMQDWPLQPGRNQRTVTFQAPADQSFPSYGVDACLSVTGEESQCSTAFDFLRDWTEFPRYGFICDFTPARKNAEATLQTLTRFHLNGLQFYDWQYRHDELIPPADDFVDPLGRPQSLQAVRDLIAAAHRHGMKAMPYLAIYAASAKFWHAHPEMALYDEKHELIPFGEEFLGIMDPTAGKGWSQHLLAECQRVLEALPYDGLHIDQYGEPQTGFDQEGEPVDLPRAFGDFIRAAVAQYPGRPVLFNAVKNWPIESLAQAPVSFNYIEIWPPKTTYWDVAEIVRNARRLSGQKPVVIALYIPANRPLNHLLADAIIHACGGTRIEVGENGRLLSDPYFPKHEAMPSALSEGIRRQTELVMRYACWIGPQVNENETVPVTAPAGIFSAYRATKAGASISLINLQADAPLNWNEEHIDPETIKNFEISLAFSEIVEDVWLATADQDSLEATPIHFEQEEGLLTITVPALKIWDVLLIKTSTKDR